MQLAGQVDRDRLQIAAEGPERRELPRVAAGEPRVASVDLRMTSRQSHSGGPEQRRFERLPINLDGLLSISGRAPVVCTVRDFCVGGMFISADPATYAAIKPQAPAVLYFALFVDSVKQDFQIQLAVARAVAKGLGVTFVNADAKALELLGHLAAASAPTAAPETAVEVGRTQQGFAAEFTVVVAPLTQLVVAQVKQLCDRFLERADEVLFLAARDAGNNVDQNRYLDGQREIRARQKRVRESVPARIETGVSILRNPLAEEDAEAAGGGPSDLSLVDKDEFEEFLVISEIVSELEPEFYDTLFALGRRFTYLANREIGLSALPLGPGVLCNAIAECLKGLQSDRRVIARVYKVLHEVMSANLGRFYDDINKLLVEHGVLPVIEKDKPVLKKKPSAATGFDAPVSELEQSSPNLVEDELADLMPGPEQYLGRLAPSPAGYPPGSIVAAPPAFSPGRVSARPPVGYPQVAAAPPTGPYRGQGAMPCRRHRRCCRQGSTRHPGSAAHRWRRYPAAIPCTVRRSIRRCLPRRRRRPCTGRCRSRRAPYRRPCRPCLLLPARCRGSWVARWATVLLWHMPRLLGRPAASRCRRGGSAAACTTRRRPCNMVIPLPRRSWRCDGS